MKLSSLLGLCLASSLSIATGATYSTNFNSFSTTPGDVAGQDDWAINSAVDLLSFVVSLNGSNAAALGGFIDAPDTATVALSHAYTPPIGESSFSFDLTMMDSTDGFPNRDSFGFSLTDGTTNLFTILLTPDAQTITPESSVAQWNLSYYTGVSPTVSLTQGILEGGLYNFDLIFSPNGATTDFDLTVSGSTAENRTGNFAVDPTTAVTDLAFMWYAFGNDPAQTGDNYMVVDNLQAIPEPSSLLLGFVGLCLGFRRQRR